jgi:signal transduction histidine kinase
VNVVIGVRPTDAARIFDLFTRGARSEQDGVGVGLAVCRKIVERHGGPDLGRAISCRRQCLSLHAVATVLAAAVGD